MPKLLLVNNVSPTWELANEPNETCLHNSFVEILFQHKKKLCQKFDDVRGTFFIDHFATTIINPKNQIIVFSTTPSVEYNLIHQGLWKHDKSFSAKYQHIHNKLYSWESAYNQEYSANLKLIKEINHGFTFGFNLSKKLKAFNIIFNFATRHHIPNFLSYYSDNIKEVDGIGNFIFTLIQEIYEKQFGLMETNSYNSISKFNLQSCSPFLKLVTKKSELS